MKVILNSAIAQAYYAKKEGLKDKSTGAGHHPWLVLPIQTARCNMAKVSYEQKTIRCVYEIMVQNGYTVPSETTGRKILK